LSYYKLEEKTNSKRKGITTIKLVKHQGNIPNQNLLGILKTDEELVTTIKYVPQFRDTKNLYQDHI